MNLEIAFHNKMTQLADFKSDDQIYLNNDTIQMKGFCHDLAKTLGLGFLPCLPQEGSQEYTVVEVAESAFRLLKPHEHLVKAEDQAGLANLRRFFIRKASNHPSVLEVITLVNECLEKLNPFKKLPAEIVQHIALVDGSIEVFNKLRLLSNPTYRALGLATLKASALMQASLQGHARSLVSFLRLLLNCTQCAKVDEAESLFSYFWTQATSQAKEELQRLVVRHQWYFPLLPIVTQTLQKSPSLEIDCQRRQLSSETLKSLLSTCSQTQSLKISELHLVHGESSNLRCIANMEKLTSLDLGSVYDFDFSALPSTLNLNGLTSLSCGLRFASARHTHFLLLPPILTQTQQTLLTHFRDFYRLKLATSDLRLLECLSLYAPREGLQLSEMPWHTMQELKHLTLYQFTFTQETMTALKALPLETLSLTGSFTPGAFAALLEITQLKKLTLCVTNPIIEYTQGLQSLTNLESFTITKTNVVIGNIGPTLCTILQSCPKLKELSLPTAQRISTEQAILIAPLLINHKSLESLTLHAGSSLPKELSSALLRIPTLRKLELSAYMDHFDQSLAELAAPSNIEQLTFTGTMTAPLFTANLNKLPHLKQLSLRLSLSDQEVKNIAALSELETLIIYVPFRISRKITDESLRMLTKLAKLSHLQITGWHDISLGCALEVLRNNRQIKKFSCAKTPASEPSILQWLLPHLKTPDQAQDPVERELLQHAKVF